MFFLCHASIGRELILIQDLLVVLNQFSKIRSCHSERLSFDPLQDVLIFAAIGSFSTQHISVTAGSKSVWYLHKLISYHLKFCAIEQIAEDLTSFQWLVIFLFSSVARTCQRLKFWVEEWILEWRYLISPTASRQKPKGNSQYREQFSK